MSGYFDDDDVKVVLVVCSWYGMLIFVNVMIYVEFMKCDMFRDVFWIMMMVELCGDVDWQVL